MVISARIDASSHIIWCKISLSSSKLLTFFRNSRWRPPSWIFILCEFGHSGVLIVWYLCSVPNVVKYVLYSHWDRRTYASDLHLMTSRELTSGFDFWSRGHLRVAGCIFPYNLMQDIFIQFKVIDIFPKFNMAAAAILDFQIMWKWPFHSVGSGVFVFCTKFGSNICYSHRDWHTYASDLNLMTSRKLTSGIDFWSRGHLRVAVVHLPIWFDPRYLYPVQSYWHFSEIQDGGRRHLGFLVYVNLAIPACW